jgi:hypothetical protein
MVAKHIASTSGKTVAPNTIRNVLHTMTIKGQHPKRTPFVSELNRKNAFSSTKTYKDKPLDFWKTVTFSD